MKTRLAILVCCGLTGCTTFPDSPTRAVVEIKDVKQAVECELAAAAYSSTGQKRNFYQWKAATDLDVTLERNFSADGAVTVGIPIGSAQGSAIPKIGGANTDTRQSSLKFGTDIPTAMNANKQCLGDNPSQTNMGLANWIVGSLETLNKDELITISYVATFKIEINGGVRFGYVLTPVVNTVDAGAGFSTYRNYTTRVSIALTPPSDPLVTPRVIIANVAPILVRPVSPAPAPAVPAPPRRPVDDEKSGPKIEGIRPESDAGTVQSQESTARPANQGGQKKARSRDVPVDARRAPNGRGSPRERVINDPILLQQLLRNSPTFRQ